MTSKEPHGEKGHLNTYTRDHDSVITAYGQHDRVVAFLPNAPGLYARVDHKWNLGEPTPAQILIAIRKDQGVKGRWTLESRTPWADGSSTDYNFVRAGQ
jgi:hypothetical protein